MSDTAPKCPSCKGPVTGTLGVPPFPFCSKRCKLVDLGNWLDGRYVVGESLAFDESDAGSGGTPQDQE